MIDCQLKTLGDNLQISCNTHDATGAEIDADAVPSYRIYENLTGTVLATGNLAKQDDANTTGFYTASVALLGAAGYEVGANYTVRTRAVVAGVAGIEVDGFRIDFMDVNVAAIDASEAAAEQLAANLACQGSFIVGAGGTVDSIPTTTILPSIEILDQLENKSIQFSLQTPTLELRGAVHRVDSVTTAGVIIPAPSLKVPPQVGDFGVFG